MPLYRVIFGNPCHFPVELEHRALWAIKRLNFDLKKADDLKKLQISELEEIQNEAYDNARISKYRIKLLHDRSINRKNFVLGQKVLLYNFRLHLFSGKLKTRWSGPYLVHTVFPHGTVEISNPKNGSTFKINGQKLKPFYTTEPESDETFELELCDPVYT